MADAEERGQRRIEAGLGLDNTQRFFYGLKFENVFLSKKGKAFEDFFASVMGHAFAGDFQRVRPYGPRGDLKCDGFRGGDGTVFQCYAPDSTRLEPLLAKIEEDFSGARTHWGSRMKRWTFVHNDNRGLPAEATQALADLRTANPGVTIEEFSFPEMRNVVMGLRLDQLEDLFGFVPSQQELQRELAKLDFAALRPILLAIQRQEPPAQPPLTAPSPHKLENNMLSQDAAELLRQGRRREKLVEDFFNNWPNPDFGEQIAEGFRAQYKSLRMVQLTPDEIFSELQAFAGGMDGTPSRQATVLAVMSYFFERCDIFEDAVQDARA